MVLAGEITAGPLAGAYFAVVARDNGRNPRQPTDTIGLDLGADQPVSCADFDLSGASYAIPFAQGDIAVS